MKFKSSRVGSPNQSSWDLCFDTSSLPQIGMPNQPNFGNYVPQVQESNMNADKNQSLYESIYQTQKQVNESLRQGSNAEIQQNVEKESNKAIENNPDLSMSASLPSSSVMQFDFTDKSNVEQKPLQTMPDNFDEKPIRPASNLQTYNEFGQDDIEDKTENDIKNVMQSKSESIKSYVNPHDEKPVGNSARGIIDEMPIKSKANNFQELLEKELRRNPHAAVIEDQNENERLPKK